VVACEYLVCQHVADPANPDGAAPSSPVIAYSATAAACAFRGAERGLVLVRAHFRAEVTVQAWRPMFEMTHRRLAPAGMAYTAMWIEDGFQPMYRRIFAEAVRSSGR
jgi:hypothetical protein